MNFSLENWVILESEGILSDLYFFKEMFMNYAAALVDKVILLFKVFKAFICLNLRNLFNKKRGLNAHHLIMCVFRNPSNFMRQQSIFVTVLMSSP